MSRTPSQAAWSLAVRAAAVLAVDPTDLGIRLRARSGPVRDRWLALAPELMPADIRWRRLPPAISDDRLLGSLDFAATIAAGRPVFERGFLVDVDGGVVVLSMAERLRDSQAARIAAAFETGEVVVEREGIRGRYATRFSLVALDEGVEPDEQPPGALCDRLALWVDLSNVAAGDAQHPSDLSSAALARARQRFASVDSDSVVVRAFCEAAAAMGIVSMRAPQHALRVARALAALRGDTRVSEVDAAQATELVLAPRARQLPEQLSVEDPPPQHEQESSGDAEPERDENRSESTGGQLAEQLIDAAHAALPPELLVGLETRPPSNRVSQRGRSGIEHRGNERGRPAGTRQWAPRDGARLDLIASLRAAAPWQRLRRRERRGTRRRIELRVDDMRTTRRVQRTATTTVFVVDASGSAALHRMAEAKGAIELMLARAYVRRDSVALVAFRDRAADVLLPPTRSLVRARRCLAALPAGGGTPLAAGLEAGTAIARAVQRKGSCATIVVLSDGRPNVSLRGDPGRESAFDDALLTARLCRQERLAAVWIDTGRRPDPRGRAIAEAMAARWIALPHTHAEAIDRAVRALA